MHTAVTVYDDAITQICKHVQCCMYMYMYMWHAHVACHRRWQSVRGFLALNAISDVGLIGDRWDSTMTGMQVVA